MGFGSVSDKELCVAAKLASDGHKVRPAPCCKEETKYARLTVESMTRDQYFIFPGATTPRTGSLWR